jgi:hypothetical protein
MQLLTAQCPYCGRDVETTIEHIAGPIVCPSCEKPFEMEMPTTKVTSVREVDDANTSKKLATEPAERILFRVHPVLFRAHPLGTMIGAAVSLASIYGLWLSLANNTLARQSTFPDSTTLGSFNWLLWLSIAALLVVGSLVFAWFVQSASTTLTLTDSRTILRRGLISRESSEVQHDDVRNIQVNQSFFQRLLRIGDIGISSSGQDDLEILIKGIPTPSRIVKTIRENQH